MANNKNLELTAAERELDENENPSLLNISASIGTANDSFNLINSESEKKYVGHESVLSVGHSRSKKNALIDSGCHCENLEKVAPDLVNNNLCELVDNELDNSLLEAKQMSTFSDITFHSNRDNSFNTCIDASFNTSANTTNNIALLFERLTLNSDGSSSPLKQCAFPDDLLPSETSKNKSTEVSLDKDVKQTNLLNASFKSEGSKVESLDNSVSLDKNLPPSPLFCSNAESDIENQVPLVLQNAIEDNVFAVETDDNLDGDEFQDAVQFFNPSSFKALESVETSHLPDTSMPRDSLYMTFDPLYKKIIQTSNVASVEVKEKDNAVTEESTGEDKCDVDSVKSEHVRESLGIKLVSFDSPVPNKSEKETGVNEISVKKEIPSQENVNSHEESKHAIDVEMFSESLVSKLEFDSPLKNFNKNSEENKDLSNESQKEEICNVENTMMFEHKIFPQESSTNLVSLGSPMKNNSEKDVLSDISVKKETFSPENDQHLIDKNASSAQTDLPMKSNLDEKDHDDLNKESIKETLQNNQKLITNVLARESLSGNLLSFDSPIKGNSENVTASSIENKKKSYSEEEFQQALKIYELTMHEAYLKKQKELEEEALKQGGETEKKLQRITKLCTVLHETVTELASVASEQNAKIGELSSKVKNLESANQELQSNYKTTTEDLQSVEHTFSDFHKRYVQCKDMLKTYKDNEDQLKTHSENLSKKLEEQEQMYTMLQVKMGEMIDKANAEVATAKKGGDAQLAVLKAQLKKSELKVSSLENDLKQTRIENDKLSSICDDLMAKVSEA